MAISPHYWPAARAEAPIHVQIRLTKRPDPARYDHHVAGKVVRVFRDQTHRLRRGSRVAFAVRYRDGTESEDREPMPGRQRVFLELDWLKAARFLEAYLRPCGPREERGDYELVWDQATALLRPTKQPVNPADREGYGVFVTDEILRRSGTKEGFGLGHWSKFWRRRLIPAIARPTDPANAAEKRGR